MAHFHKEAEFTRYIYEDQCWHLYCSK